MTLQQVVDRVGRYDRVRGSGIQYYEWDLADGSAALISVEHPFQLSNRVQGIAFFRTPEEIHLFP